MNAGKANRDTPKAVNRQSEATNGIGRAIQSFPRSRETGTRQSIGKGFL